MAAVLTSKADIAKMRLLRHSAVNAVHAFDDPKQIGVLNTMEGFFGTQILEITERKRSGHNLKICITGDCMGR
jgi:hypothetical protein